MYKWDRHKDIQTSRFSFSIRNFLCDRSLSTSLALSELLMPDISIWAKWASLSLIAEDSVSSLKNVMKVGLNRISNDLKFKLTSYQTFRWGVGCVRSAVSSVWSQYCPNEPSVEDSSCTWRSSRSTSPERHPLVCWPASDSCQEPISRTNNTNLCFCSS